MLEMHTPKFFIFPPSFIAIRANGEGGFAIILFGAETMA
jgi:hypothetical protein